MPTLETPPNPSSPPAPDSKQYEPIKVRTGRFGELEEHELVHLLDSLDDERARARFREAIYISIFIWIFIAWAAIYGIRFLPIGPTLVNRPIKSEREMASLDMPKDLARELARHPHPTPRPLPPVVKPSPSPVPAPAAKAQPSTPAPETQPHANTPQPPVASVPAPAPSAPAPQQAMVDAPRPSFSRPGQSPGSAIQDAIRNAGRPGGADNPGAIYGGGRSPLGSGAEILTDTQGVDFDPWLRRFKVDVMRNWTPLIPESVNPPISKRGIVGIRITILQGGKIGNVVLEGKSGDYALDKAAWNALISEGTYPPLPREFPGPSIELRCTFLYNETP